MSRFPHHWRPRHLRGVSAVAVLLAGCLLSAGCGKAPKLAAEDKPAIDALQSYHGAHKLDNQGRVIELTLEGKHVDDLALDHVKALTALRRLSLYGASVTDDGIAKLHSLPRLEALGLADTQVTDNALLHLKKSPALAHLWVSKNGKITNKGLEALKRDLPGLVVYRQ